MGYLLVGVCFPVYLGVHVSDQDQPASFIAYANRRKLAKAFPESSSVPPSAEARHVASVWEQAVAEHGTSLTNPDVAAAVVGVSELLERLIYRALTARYGDKARGIPANPDDGIDHAGAQAMIDLLDGLRNAPAIIRAEAQPAD